MDNERFDQLARVWAAGSRRKFLRSVVGATLLGALGTRGVEDASAQACKGGGGKCHHGSDCCSGVCKESKRHKSGKCASGCNALAGEVKCGTTCCNDLIGEECCNGVCCDAGETCNIYGHCENPKTCPREACSADNLPCCLPTSPGGLAYCCPQGCSCSATSTWGCACG